MLCTGKIQCPYPLGDYLAQQLIVLFANQHAYPAGNQVSGSLEESFFHRWFSVRWVGVPSG
ncbi:hypothetical protein FGKAn22_07930 [Ferrigenium kumadai]|uniref:Uncharacterized protein n=1 Tax=Ferrigenium kumadai TaxID=1682490 RepID=A0AAN1SY27_9PROT|nr:hypothetical protein FGKAn22_07930 [Ferrigenium kumadai]